MGRSDHTSYLYAAMTNVCKVTQMKKMQLQGYICTHTVDTVQAFLRAISATFKSSSKFPS